MNTQNCILSRAAAFLLAAAAAIAVGCDDNAEFLTEDRLSEGMVVILPGVEGASGLNKDIRDGLLAAGIPHALPIRNWGRPVPLLGVVINQVDFLGNRLAAHGIARYVMDYKEKYPGKPVYIVGHSGGGGIAIFVAEYLDEDKKVDGVIVLSGSVTSAYNLQKALSRTRNGIVNFYNRSDSALLAVGTTVLGNVDGTHGPAAGLIGFDEPRDNDKDYKKLAYTKLYQVEITGDMMLGGDSHTAVTQPAFVATFVAPWVYSPIWPATYARCYTYRPAPAADNEDKPNGGQAQSQDNEDLQ